MSPVDLLIPVYNEGPGICKTLTNLKSELEKNAATINRILIVYDSPDDSSLPHLHKFSENYPFKISLVQNIFGRGYLNALKTGFQITNSDYVIVVMADQKDPATVISSLIATAFHEAADIVAASRYMHGGSQTGGPKLKKMLSRAAGLSLHLFLGLGTSDPTNNFKLYKTAYLKSVQLESQTGFEVAFELALKAHIAGKKILEVPTHWKDRSDGKSNFNLWRQIPSYLNWYMWFLFQHLKKRPSNQS